MKKLYSKEIIQLDDLIINRIAHEVRVKGVSLKLTRKMFGLLWALGTHPEKVFHRDELLAMIWGPGITVEIRTVDAHVARLRKILSKQQPTSFSIETVWGIGYRLRTGTNGYQEHGSRSTTEESESLSVDPSLVTR